MPARPPVLAAATPAPDSCTNRRRSMRVIPSLLMTGVAFGRIVGQRSSLAQAAARPALAAAQPRVLRAGMINYGKGHNGGRIAATAAGLTKFQNPLPELDPGIYVFERL